MRILSASGVAGPEPGGASYLVQEEDNTSKIILEEGTDFLLLEESA